MAKVSPSGTSVSRVFPSSLVVQPSLWTVEYQVNFAAEGTHAFKTTAEKALGGVTWTAVNADKATKFELSSSGLELDPEAVTSSGTSWWATTQTSPYLWAKLGGSGGMVPTLAEDDTVALQLYIDSSPDVTAAWDAYGLALSEPGNTHYLVARRLHNGTNARIDSFIVNENYDQIVEATQQTFFEIVLSPGNGAVTSIGVYDGSFPDPLLTPTTYQSYASLSGILGPGGTGGSSPSEPVPSWNIPWATTQFVILAQSLNSNTSLTTTSYKMRVLRRKKK